MTNLDLCAIHRATVGAAVALAHTGPNYGVRNDTTAIACSRTPSGPVSRRRCDLAHPADHPDPTDRGHGRCGRPRMLRSTCGPHKRSVHSQSVGGLRAGAVV
jgi:hypothetical protein